MSHGMRGGQTCRWAEGHHGTCKAVTTFAVNLPIDLKESIANTAAAMNTTLSKIVEKCVWERLEGSDERM